MNYLAHLYLSFEDPDIMAGNLQADFLNGKPPKHLPPGIIAGIILHREIDSYTDSHPVVKLSKKRLYKTFKKYAPVVVDVFYDHLLAINWETYHHESLRVYAEASYKKLQSRLQYLPPKLQTSLPYMISGNWLEGYSELGNLAFVFQRMEMRTKFQSKLYLATDFLKDYFEEFNEEFNLFFPELIAYAKQQLAFKMEGDG